MILLNILGSKDFGTNGWRENTSSKRDQTCELDN